MTYLVLSFVFALSASFLCSLLESSVLSLRPADIARLRQRSPTLGELWERLRSNIGQPIAVILILNTVANVVGATIAGARFAELFGSRWLWLFSLGFALLLIQWGEILPKTLGVRYRRFVVARAGRPLAGAIQLLRPVMWLIRFFNRPFESKVAGESPSTVDEIRSLARYASFARVIDRRQENLITKSMQIHQMKVARIMVPRPQVAALEVTATIAELLALVYRTGVSRVPVYRVRIDDVVGVVLVKDILIALHTGKLRSGDFASRRVGGFLSEPVFVPDSASVAQMMAKAAEHKSHMVIVLDEHGGFAGLATLEDALEEMFGEIVDEHDPAEHKLIERVARGQWLAAGTCPIDEVSKAVGIELGSKQGRYSTLSGLLMWLSGRVPTVGDEIGTDALRFRVLEATRTAPRKVEISRTGGSHPSEIVGRRREG